MTPSPSPSGMSVEEKAEARLMAEHFPAMLKALQSMAIWITHWQRDVSCGLKPTPQSLATAAEEVRAALSPATQDQKEA